MLKKQKQNMVEIHLKTFRLETRLREVREQKFLCVYELQSEGNPGTTGVFS